MSEVLNHPFLMSLEKKMDFVIEVWKMFDEEKPAISNSLNNNYRGWNAAFSEDIVVDMETWRGSSYNYNNLLDLVYFVRNLEAHSQKKKSVLKLEDNKLSKSTVINMVLKLYPSFIIDLWNLVEQK